MLLRAGYIIFSNTPINTSLQENAAPLDFRSWYFDHEYLVDPVRIQICYEHYLKARALLAGYVVRKFHKPSRFRELREPDTQLVTIENLRQNAEFIYEPEKQCNEIEELSDQTLGFSGLIALHAIYLTPEHAVNSLLQHKKHRNMLHFTGAQPESFDPAAIRDFIAHIDGTVLSLTNILADELALPTLRL